MHVDPGPADFSRLHLVQSAQVERGLHHCDGHALDRIGLDADLPQARFIRAWHQRLDVDAAGDRIAKTVGAFEKSAASREAAASQQAGQDAVARHQWCRQRLVHRDIAVPDLGECVGARARQGHGIGDLHPAEAEQLAHRGGARVGAGRGMMPTQMPEVAWHRQIGECKLYFIGNDQRLEKRAP